MRDIRSVTVWGDSVMKGVVYDEEKERYTLLPECSANRASRALGLRLRNRSRMGLYRHQGAPDHAKGSGDRRRRAAWLSSNSAGTDCDYDWAQVAQRPLDPHQPKTPLEIFLSQLREMVHLAKQKGMEPVMMTLPPIHAERYFNFFTRGGLNRENILLWLGDIQFIYRWHERYNAAVIRVAKECGCLLADVREAFLGQRHYEDLLCADGIHPNEKGHILMDGVLEDYGGVLRRPLAAAE